MSEAKIYISEPSVVTADSGLFQEVAVSWDGYQMGLLMRRMVMDSPNSYAMGHWYPDNDLWMDLCRRGYTKDMQHTETGDVRRIEPFTDTSFASITQAKASIAGFLQRVYYTHRPESEAA